MLLLHALRSSSNGNTHEHYCCKAEKDIQKTNMIYGRDKRTRLTILVLNNRNNLNQGAQDIDINYFLIYHVQGI